MWIALMVCRSFRESEESTSPSKNGCGHVFIAKWMSTVNACYCPECKMEILIEHQYGTISKHSDQESRDSPRMLISSSAGSLDHARISALQELKEAWILSEVDCFSNSRDWLRKLNPNLFFLKTLLILSKSEEIKSLKSLTRWGWTVGGRAFLPKIVGHCINEIVGFSWPTPTASQAGKPIRKPSLTRRLGLHGYDLQESIGEVSPELIGQKINVHFLEWLMGLKMNWTELEPWVMQWYRLRLKKHSKS